MLDQANLCLIGAIDFENQVKHLTVCRQWSVTFTHQFGTAGDELVISCDAYGGRGFGGIYVIGTTTSAFPGFTNLGGKDVLGDWILIRTRIKIKI